MGIQRSKEGAFFTERLSHQDRLQSRYRGRDYRPDGPVNVRLQHYRFASVVNACFLRGVQEHEMNCNRRAVASLGIHKLFDWQRRDLTQLDEFILRALAASEKSQQPILLLDRQTIERFTSVGGSIPVMKMQLTLR
jgi:hypothetical protein